MKKVLGFLGLVFSCLLFLSSFGESDYELLLRLMQKYKLA